jgi:hypothetical protein
MRQACEEARLPLVNNAFFVDGQHFIDDSHARRVQFKLYELGD